MDANRTDDVEYGRVYRERISTKTVNQVERQSVTFGDKIRRFVTSDDRSVRLYLQLGCNDQRHLLFG